ncbi:MAG TPA: sugar phosphate nucleotidyltransferase, partial [Caulobacteraceae bacterium]|nr:sugar phosphate nucleotidyltransferase [Caulobacteraceae bacterium]
MRLHPVILCGGPGARLWPASTTARPKPFLDLIDGLTPFQRTLQRVAAIEGAARPLVITGADHAATAAAQIGASGLAAEILVEPEGRDSAAAAFAAALWVERIAADDLVLLVAADHHIPDLRAFAEGVERAAPAAQLQGRIVVFGLQPSRPATEFGYILPGGQGASPGVRTVSAFVEKPDADRAAELIERGALWNSGNFLFRADAMIEEAARFAPQALDAVRSALPPAEGPGRGGGPTRLGAGFSTAPRISLDRAVIEKTSRAAVVAVAYDWSDLGSWEAVWAASARDVDGLVCSGPAAAVDSRDSLLRADGGARILALGVQNLAIVANGSDVLVSALERSGDLKAALERAPDPPAPDLADIAHRLSSWWREQALPLWWCFGADLVDGGFHDQIGADLRPLPLAKRLRVQARQTMVYAQAGSAGWPGPWRIALDHGLAALHAGFMRADGLLRPAAAAAHTPEAPALLYDQAF